MEGLQSTNTPGIIIVIRVITMKKKMNKMKKMKKKKKIMKKKKKMMKKKKMKNMKKIKKMKKMKIYCRGNPPLAMNSTWILCVPGTPLGTETPLLLFYSNPFYGFPPLND